MRASLALLLCLSAAPAVADVAMAGGNPIRKVVTMLQNMEKKVQAEGEKEKELFEKYMCYCKNAGGDLSKSIGDADTKIPQLGADIKEGEAKAKKTEDDFNTFVEGLQKSYEDASKKKDEDVAAIKNSGLGFAKAVKAANAKGKQEL